MASGVHGEITHDAEVTHREQQVSHGVGCAVPQPRAQSQAKISGQARQGNAIAEIWSACVAALLRCTEIGESTTWRRHQYKLVRFDPRNFIAVAERHAPRSAPLRDKAGCAAKHRLIYFASLSFVPVVESRPACGKAHTENQPSFRLPFLCWTRPHYSPSLAPRPCREEPSCRKATFGRRWGPLLWEGWCAYSFLE